MSTANNLPTLGRLQSENALRLLAELNAQLRQMVDGGTTMSTRERRELAEMVALMTVRTDILAGRPARGPL